jgi:ABC-2 type transport system ATP-binding protein
VLEIRTDRPQQALALLKTVVEPWRASLFGDRIHVMIDQGGEAASGGLAERLREGGIRVIEITEQDYSLEDVFLQVVERSDPA